MEPHKFNVVIVSGPFDDVIGKAIITSFIQILKPLANKIYCITGNIQSRSDEEVYVFKMLPTKKKEGIITRLFRFIQRQLRITYYLFKISDKVDVVIFREGAGIYLLPALSAKLLRKKLVVTAPGLFSKTAEKLSYKTGLFRIKQFVISRIYRALEWIIFFVADQIIAESESAIKFLGLDNYKKKLAISGLRYVDTDVFKIKKHLRDRKNMVGFVGRLIESKGVMNFVKAMPLILRDFPEVNFFIGGNGPLFSQIDDELSDSGLSNIVKMSGWISPNEVSEYLNELKILVLPSFSEGLPTIVLEAMACGTPVLSTSVGSVPDVIEDGKTGFILQDNSPECIARNVIRALSCSKLAEITEHAHRIIQERYTYSSIVKNFKDILYRRLKR